MNDATFGLQFVLTFFTISSIFLVVSGQNSSAMCTKSMIQSFNPCTSFLTQGKGSPPANCCASLKQLMGNGQNCLCLIITGGVSFKLPINRTLAMSLPRACKMQGVPVECKAPVPPTPDPGSPVKNSPRSTTPPPPSPPAPFGQKPLTPDNGIIPRMTPPGMRPTLTLSNAQPLNIIDYISFLVISGVIWFISV